MAYAEEQRKNCDCPCHQGTGDAVHVVPRCHRPFGPVRNLLKSYLLTLAIPVRRTTERLPN